MGILNVTPDSFYDGGRYPTVADLLNRTEVMLKEGATFIDIGAVSSKPGAGDVGEDEELARLVPVLNAVRQRFPETIISVDTWRSKVALEALDLGAALINDISGGRFDPSMMTALGSRQAPYIIMHMQGTPADMQLNPVYDNVLKQVMHFLAEQSKLASESGISDVIVDPGFGFGKNLEQNYALLAGLEYFHFIDCPLMVGVSRKSMINKLLKTKPENALNGTTVLNTVALLKGADILRVHDVKEAAQAIEMVAMLGNYTTSVTFPS